MPPPCACFVFCFSGLIYFFFGREGSGLRELSGSGCVFKSWDRGKLKTGKTSWDCRESWGPWPRSVGCGAGQGGRQQGQGGGSAGCQPGPGGTGTPQRVTHCYCGTIPGEQGVQKCRETILGGEGPEGGLCSSECVDHSGGGEWEGSVQAVPSSACLPLHSAVRFVPLKK